MSRRARFECPHCGAVFRAGRLACPECGSDAETGWRESDDVDYLSIELPDPPDAAPRSSRGPALWFLIAAVAALAAMLVFILR